MEILKQFVGELELIGKKGNEVIFYDKGHNTVTIWAKQATMHLLTGEAFSSHGRQRKFDTDGAPVHTKTATLGEGINPDGTLLSGQPFFKDNSLPNFDIDSRWIKSTIIPDTTLGDVSATPSSMKYPAFPTKMLFGTGFEFSNWASIPEDYKQKYTQEGWNSGNFDPNINHSDNIYSAEYANGLVQKRTMNDIYLPKKTDVPDDKSFAVKGAIKNGTYTDSSTQRGLGSANPRVVSDGEQEYLIQEYQGIGEPAFIYARRESRYFQTASEIQLSADDNIENKITYTVVMPETSSGAFYPYNGYTIKEAGLFCDARFLLFNTNPTSTLLDHANELINYNKMPYGMMFAKRYVAPFTKTPEVSLTARWTLYL